MAGRDPCAIVEVTFSVRISVRVNNYKGKGWEGYVFWPAPLLSSQRVSRGVDAFHFPNIIQGLAWRLTT